VPRLEFALLGGAVTAMLVETVAAVFTAIARPLRDAFAARAKVQDKDSDKHRSLRRHAARSRELASDRSRHDASFADSGIGESPP
jgi:hypothetical protein